jgi:hypothetical protein
MEGNYQVMSGVCPYWDSVTRDSKKSGSSR